MQKSSPVSVGIDVGTTHVRTVVGVLGEDSAVPTIVGAGSSPTRGMRKGVVINVDEVATSISMSIEEAERISGQTVSSASISVNGSHIIGLNSKGVVAISSVNHEITPEDLMRVEEAATVVQLPANREILQVFAKNYAVDGQENIKEPLGMSGVRMEVDAHIVTSATPAIKNLERTLELAGVNLNHQIVAGLASAESVLEPQQRENGAVVIDFGAGTTNVTVYNEDDVQHVAVLPVGSINLTNDLAIGLKTDLDIAEQVKLKHASADPESKNKKSVELSKGEETFKFERGLVNSIVSSRMEEIFELVDDELKKINKSGKLPGGAVLVGGGALLPGIDELAKKVLNLPARVSTPKNYSGIIDTTDTPEYAAAVGLMMLDMRLSEFRRNSDSSGINLSAISDTIKKLVQKLKF